MYDFDSLSAELQQRVIEQARQQYSEQVVANWLNPDHLGRIANPDGRARLRGSCHDTVEVFIKLQGGKIAQARFSTDGCITTIASSNVAMQLAEDKSPAAALGIDAQAILETLGGLPAESEHCAELAAEALRASLRDCLTKAAEPWKKLYR